MVKIGLEGFNQQKMAEQLDVEESKRVSTQIMTLSTQLIESIEKQSTLEKELNQANRAMESQTAAFEEHQQITKRLELLEKVVAEKNEGLKSLKEELRKEREAKAAAEANVDKLNREVEDLTASLFDEANNMVADARKASHALEIKNAKLVEQLQERDTLLETLNLQLRHLKKVIQNLDDNSAASEQVKALANASDSASLTASLSKTFSPNFGHHTELPLGPIFSPNITSVRYDLGLYNEFLKFIALLPTCQDIKDTSSESKLLRRLINDEIQPILKLENASGLGWIVKRTLVNLMMEGLVVVEPISGLNEKHQYGYGSPSLNQQNKNDLKDTSSEVHSITAKNIHLFNYPSDSPPVAVREKCAICAESRDDLVEHARLHLLKTQTRADDGTLTVTNTFPLCKYCVLKVRQTCEIFAFLRSLKLGAWKLEKVSLTGIDKGESREFSEVSSLSNNEDALKNVKDNKKESWNAHRMSFISSMGSLNKITTVTPEVPVSQSGAPTTNIQRAWVQLCRLRSMLHWTHIGIWNVEDSISSRIGPFAGDESDDELVKLDTRQSKSSSDQPSVIKQTLADQTPVLEEGSPSFKDRQNSEGDTFDFETNAEGQTVVTLLPGERGSVNDEENSSSIGRSNKSAPDEEKDINLDSNIPKDIDIPKLAETSSKDLMANLDRLGEQLKVESGKQDVSKDEMVKAKESNGTGTMTSEAASASLKGDSGSMSPRNDCIKSGKHRSIKSFIHSDTESASNTDDQFDDAQESQ